MFNWVATFVKFYVEGVTFELDRDMLKRFEKSLTRWDSLAVLIQIHCILEDQKNANTFAKGTPGSFYSIVC